MAYCTLSDCTFLARRSPLMDNSFIFVAKDSNITMSEIVELAFDSYFTYCDDVDSDIYENLQKLIDLKNG